jgi:hypothetical protein
MVGADQPPITARTDASLAATTSLPLLLPLLPLPPLLLSRPEKTVAVERSLVVHHATPTVLSAAAAPNTDTAAQLMVTALPNRDVKTDARVETNLPLPPRVPSQ